MASWFSLSPPSPTAHPAELTSFPACFPRSFYYGLSFKLKVSQQPEQPYGALVPVPNFQVARSIEEPLPLTRLPPCLSPHSALLNLFHFLPRPERSGLWPFVWTGPLTEDFLEIPASPAPGSHPRLPPHPGDSLLALLPQEGPLLSSHPPLLCPVYVTISLGG